MEVSGRLALFPMTELLGWAYKEKSSGSLVLRRSNREKRLYFAEGQIIACLTDEPAEFYGRMLLLHGYLDQPTLLRSLTLCKTEGKRLEGVLREHHILPPEVIQATLRRQIEDVVCDIFLWRHGLFFFQADLPPAEEVLAEPLDPMALALEGSQWEDAFRTIRRAFPHNSTVLRRGPAWPGTELTPLETHIAREVNGDRSLEEIHERLKGSYFRFMQAAYNLVQARILEVAVEGKESMTTSLELSLFDLLLEQAAEEQVLYSHRHFALPLDLLERFVPVWTHEPGPEDWYRVPDRAKEFYLGFDGKNRLGDLFSQDLTLRSQEIELLLLELRKGTVALLPQPLTQLFEDLGEPENEKERWWQRLLSRRRHDE